MKIFTKKLLVALILLSFIPLKAQQDTLLKAFINKNDFALHGFQKYVIKLSDKENENEIKELLKYQIASIKLYGTDLKKSAALAYIVRERCEIYLAKSTSDYVKYLRLSSYESAYFAGEKPVVDAGSYLNKTEKKSIDAIDIKDPHLFNNFSTRIK
ncbi:MAG: hypothetical protein SFY56_06490 [Bacteroidota bacterium]|nr:hypothetical protein [Bacteroidota bacterium]